MKRIAPGAALLSVALCFAACGEDEPPCVETTCMDCNYADAGVPDTQLCDATQAEYDAFEAAAQISAAFAGTTVVCTTTTDCL